MTESEFKVLTENTKRPTVIRGQHLKNKTPRTLLWGYDTDRNSWHVYLDSRGVITYVKYSFTGNVIAHMEEQHPARNEEYLPNKRLYPEACDLEFSKLLTEAGCRMPWTTFNAQRTLGLWHGKRLEELVGERLAKSLISGSLSD